RQAERNQENIYAQPLFAIGGSFAEEQAYIARDREVYREDVRLRGQRLTVQFPGDPPKSHHSALYLDNPKSLLFKFWSRQDTEGPPPASPYHFLAVKWGTGHWVFSTDPVQRLSLQGLAEPLQTAEEKHDPAFAAAHRWYDGHDHNYTLVAYPDDG